MLPIITLAVGTAYIARKQYDKSLLNATKARLLNKITFKKSEIIATHFTEESWQELNNPLTLLENTANLEKFSYALTYLLHSKQLMLYNLILEFQNTIKSIQDIATIEWLDLHIGYYLDMLGSLYFNKDEISYVRVAKLIVESNNSDIQKKATLNVDIVACKEIIELIEFFLPYYRAMILNIISNPQDIKHQSALNDNFNLIKSIISRKISSLNNIFKHKNFIQYLENTLQTNLKEEERNKNNSLLARYRSQLALESLELYFLLVVKKNFLENKPQPIELLERYNAALEKFNNFHEDSFKSTIIMDIEFLSYDNTDFYIPKDILREINLCATEFKVPIPDYKEIFVTHCRPPVPPRPKKQPGYI